MVKKVWLGTVKSKAMIQEQVECETKTLTFDINEKSVGHIRTNKSNTSN